MLPASLRLGHAMLQGISIPPAQRRLRQVRAHLLLRPRRRPRHLLPLKVDWLRIATTSKLPLLESTALNLLINGVIFRSHSMFALSCV